MIFNFRFFISLLLICFFPLLANAENYSVGFERIFVPIEYDKSYLEVSLWYPTEDKAKMQSVETGGEKFLLSKNAKKIDGEQNLLLISQPTFAESNSFSSLSYSLAKAGIFVAVLTHVGDWEHDMHYTLTAHQHPIRALHLKSTIKYLQEEKKLKINFETLSTLSFAETALAPLLMYSFPISYKNFEAFCKTYPNEAICNLPMSGQINRMYADISYQLTKKAKEKDFFVQETARIQTENELLKQKWEKEVEKAKKAAARAKKTEAEEVPEPEYLPLPPPVKEIDAYYPNIKNFFLVEPSFSFLLDAQLNENDSYKIYALNAVGKNASNNADLNFLNKHYGKSFKQVQVSMTSYFDLLDRCNKHDNEDPTEICSQISKDTHIKIINSFVNDVIKLMHKENSIGRN